VGNAADAESGVVINDSSNKKKGNLKVESPAVEIPKAETLDWTVNLQTARPI
jgi:hypothetical protein